MHGFEKKNMKIKCDDPVRGAIIEGLTEVIISNPEDALGLLVDGEENRHVAGTDMNERSSRSHTVFRVIIETKPTEEAEARRRASMEAALPVAEKRHRRTRSREHLNAPLHVTATGCGTGISHCRVVCCSVPDRIGVAGTRRCWPRRRSTAATATSRRCARARPVERSPNAPEH